MWNLLRVIQELDSIGETRFGHELIENLTFSFSTCLMLYASQIFHDKRLNN